MKHAFFVVLFALSACSIEAETERNPVDAPALERPPHPLCECPDFGCRERRLCAIARTSVCVVVDCGGYVLDDCVQCEDERRSSPATELSR
jgi:hypothetical protein